MAQNIIPSDEFSSFDLIKALSTLEQLAIIRPNNPPAGVAGFVFDIRGDEWVELQSFITDHFVEDNTAIQDQIALGPEQVTVRGLVAELTSQGAEQPQPNPPANPLPSNVPMQPTPSAGSLGAQLAALASNAGRTAVASVLSGTGVKGALKNAGTSVVANVQGRATDVALGAVRSLLQPGSVGALLSTGINLPLDTQNAVNVLRSVIPKTANAVIDAIKTQTSAPSKALLASSHINTSTANNTSLHQAYVAKQPTQPKNTRQSSAFLYFYALWKGRQLFSVETPWGIWTNMAILMLRGEQDEDSKWKTNFSITFKKIRFVQAVAVQLGQLAGRSSAQTGASNPTTNGNAGKTAATPQQEQSWLYQWKNGP